VRQRVNVSLGSPGTNFIAIELHATGAGRAHEFGSDTLRRMKSIGTFLDDRKNS